MTAILYNNTSDNKKLNKNLNTISTVDLTLYLDTNVLNPTFKIKNFNNNANYIYVQDLGRYYFIDNYILSNQCVYLHCSVDVLMSYKNEILNHEFLIKRNEFLRDTQLTDAEIQLSCKKQIVTEKISEQFINDSIGCYIIGVI